MVYPAQLAKFNRSEARMTSRQLAEVMGVAHRNVLRTIRDLESQGLLLKSEQRPFLEPRTGRTYTEYALTPQQAMLLLVGRNSAMRSKVVGRWLELEQESRKPVEPEPTTAVTALPQNYLEALRALVKAEEAKQALETANQKLLPAAAVAERIAEAEGLHDWLETSKILNFGGGRTTLLRLLKARGVLNERNLPYQRHIAAGRFRVVESTWTGPDGADHVHAKTLTTGKGLAWLAGHINNDPTLKKESQLCSTR